MATQNTRRAQAPRRRASASRKNSRMSASQSYNYPHFRASNHPGTKCTGRDMEDIIGSCIQGPLKNRALTNLNDRRDRGVKTDMKRFLRWIWKESVSLEIVMEHFHAFGGVRQKTDETSQYYWT